MMILMIIRSFYCNYFVCHFIVNIEKHKELAESEESAFYIEQLLQLLKTTYILNIQSERK